MGRTPAGETRDKIWKFVRERLLAGLPPTVREVQAAFGFRAVQTAREHLEALVAEGKLAKEPGRARGYRLPFTSGRFFGAESAPVMVPILGRIQAGALDYAVEDLEGYVPVQAPASRVPVSRVPVSRVPVSRVPASQISGRRTQQQAARSAAEEYGSDLFGLRVRGESMRNAGILPDDIVVVRRQSTARSGDIVVALIGEEATVKRLRLRGRRVELHPENPDFEPVVFESGVFESGVSESAAFESQAPAPEEVILLGKVIEVRRFL